jgi:hypothetical protein
LLGVSQPCRALVAKQSSSGLTTNGLEQTSTPEIQNFSTNILLSTDDSNYPHHHIKYIIIGSISLFPMKKTSPYVKTRLQTHESEMNPSRKETLTGKTYLEQVLSCFEDSLGER